VADDTTTSSDALSDVHVRALRRFDDTAMPQQDLRRQSLAARRFASIPGAQWEGSWGEQFENSIRIEVPKIGRRISKIQTDYRQNRIAPDFRPDGPEADQDTADTLDGMHRADSYRYKAQQARDNAFYEAVSGGFGAYRLANVFEDEEDPENDNQRVNPGVLIADADQLVYFDAQSRLYDKSDARFAFVLLPYTPDAYREEWDETCDGWPEAVDRPKWDWFAPETWYAAEYYEIEHKAAVLHIFNQTLTGDEERLWSDEIDAAGIADKIAAGWMHRTQRRKRKRVHKYIMSGARVLSDEGYIAGCCIPIVPVYGKREFVDGMERWKGETQDRMDVQRVYNSNVSRLAEINALSPREIPIFAPEQMQGGLGDMWANMHIERHAYALANPLTDPQSGALVNGGGPIGYVKPPDVPQVTAALLQLTNGDLTEEDRDGADEVKANTSAEAMDIAASRVDAKSGIYLDNMRQSVQREGEIYLSMASEIYADEGREVETMSEDGDDGIAVLSERYATTEGEHKLRNDLTRAKYKVIASVSEATATRRDKTVRSMLATAEAAVAAQDMELAQICLRTAVMNQDGEGLADVKTWVRKALVQMGAVEPNEEEQKALAEQAAQPDPASVLADAQGKALEAAAVKDIELAKKAEADTGLSKAKTVETLTGIGQPANDAAAPRILRGNQLP
jgi:hypothetical protein